MCVIDLKDEEVGVMMGWERPISKSVSFSIPAKTTSHGLFPIVQKTVQNLFRGLESNGGLKILNVGFGLGIVNRPTQPILRFIHILRSD
jgi:hypothetical protein